SVVKIKFSEKTESEHYLYLKAHSVRDKCEEKPPERTLFIIGVPPYACEESLKRAFSICGKINTVYIHLKPTSSLPSKNSSDIFKDFPDIKGFKVAYVVFETSNSLKSALSLDLSTTLILSTDENPVRQGILKWCQEYNKRAVNVQSMMGEINLYMEDYDRKIEEEETRMKQALEPDEEGWITVTKKGRKPGFARKESLGKKIMAKEKLKRSKKQLMNFYRFQIRESKMNHLMSLREKFEEDKKKIARMKQTRKFKPF
ncbi:hypothetical protein AAG570_013382, partial [Ranatra chinensis]